MRLFNTDSPLYFLCWCFSQAVSLKLNINLWTTWIIRVFVLCREASAVSLWVLPSVSFCRLCAYLRDISPRTYAHPLRRTCSLLFPQLRIFYFFIFYFFLSRQHSLAQSGDERCSQIRMFCCTRGRCEFLAPLLNLSTLQHSLLGVELFISPLCVCV